jgi:hypothetical protein
MARPGPAVRVTVKGLRTEMLNKLLRLPDDPLPEQAKPTTKGFWGRSNAEQDAGKRQQMVDETFAKEKARIVKRKARTP